MRKLLFALVVTLMGMSQQAESQDKFFTLSGGSRGDAASSKLEVLHKQLRERQDKDEDCAAQGKIRAPKHAKAGEGGCVDSVVIEQTGDVTLENNITVGGAVRIGGPNGKLVQTHALEDPNTCSDNEKLYWDGSDWACRKEVDPKVGTLSSGKWCAERGGKVVCDREPPAVEGALDGAVHTFALKSASFPTGGCSDGQVLTTNGSALSCVTDGGGKNDTLLLSELDDVSLNNTQHGDVLTFNAAGNVWVSAGEGDPTVEDYAKFPVQKAGTDMCGIGYVITLIDNKLECVPDAGGAADALFLGELADVTNTAASTTQVLAWVGDEWAPSDEGDPTVMDWAKVNIANTTSVSSVFRCQSNEMITYDGNQLGCALDVGSAGTLYLNDMIDVSHSTPPVTNHVLAFDGTNWISQEEIDPTVETFAKTVLPTCAVGEVLRGDGTSLSCVADAGGSADPIALNDIDDVVITAAASGQMFRYDGTNWINDTGPEDFATTPVINTVTGSCPAGAILTYDGSQLSCVAGTSIGLWTDNTTYISRSGMHVVDSGQTLPAALTGAGSRVLWYPDKAAFRAGEARGGEWDDANIGDNSVAFGNDVQASGDSSFAATKGAQANGDTSVAIGEIAIANGNNSIALGSRIQVDGTNSVAIGLGSPASTRVIADNDTFAVVGGQMVISDTAATADLLLDVEGKVGSVEYCDENGAFCTTAADINAVAGGGVIDIDLLADASASIVTESVFLGEDGGSVATGNENTSVGFRALRVLTTGNQNTAIGHQTMDSLTTGRLNTAVGKGALASIDDDDNNTAFGLQALNALTNGDNNVAVGRSAAANQTSGSNNIAIGSGVNLLNTTGSDQLNIGNLVYGDLAAGSATIAGDLLTTGNGVFENDLTVRGNFFVSGTQSIDGVIFANGGVQATGNISATTFTGDGSGLTNLDVSNLAIELDDLDDAMRNVASSTVVIGHEGSTITSGYDITALGENVLASSTTGNRLVVIGNDALQAVVDAERSVAIGSSAMELATNGYNNTAVGHSTLRNVTNGHNTAVGSSALGAGAPLYHNTAVGSVALTNSNGGNNTAVGHAALSSIASGNSNIALGRMAGANQTGGDDNIVIGTGIDLPNLTGSDQLNIGNLIVGDMAGGSATVAGDFNANNARFDGDLTVTGNINVSGTQNIDGVIFANGGVQATGNISATTFTGDGSGLTNLDVANLAIAIDDLDDAMRNAASGTIVIGHEGSTITSGQYNSVLGEEAFGNSTTGEHNTVFGYRAMRNNTTGNHNSAFGSGALHTVNTTAHHNVAIGRNALYANINGDNNTAVGNYSLDGIGLGSNNTALGYQAAGNQTSGNNNIAIGYLVNLPNTTGSNQLNIGNLILGDMAANSATIAGDLLTTGNSRVEGTLTVVGALNVSGSQTIDGVVFANGGVQATGTISATEFVGDGSKLTNLDVSNLAIGIDDLADAKHDTDDYSSLFLGNGAGANDDGTNNRNVAVGRSALMTNTTGNRNIALGVESLYSNTSGSHSVGLGYQALYANTTGSDNVATGHYAMLSNTTGFSNLASGNYALQDNTTGNYNTAVGIFALQGNVAGLNNTAVGESALVNLTAGDSNLALGKSAAFNQTAGSNNIAIGAGALLPSTTASNQLNIGDAVYGTGVGSPTPKIAIGDTVDAAAHATLDVSGTVKVAGTGAEVCNASNLGSIRFNPSTGKMQICRQ